jgi:hypothetical protein
MLEYKITFEQYNQNKLLYSNCNTITFINYGTSTVNIENVALTQYQQLVIEGNYCEFNNQQYNMFFTGTGTNNLVVIKKSYISNE